jgi:hypothetical protein
MYRIYFPMLFNGGVFWFFPDNPIETDLTGWVRLSYSHSKIVKSEHCHR